MYKFEQDFVQINRDNQIKICLPVLLWTFDGNWVKYVDVVQIYRRNEDKPLCSLFDGLIHGM
jgi:hypothetical protein